MTGAIFLQNERVELRTIEEEDLGFLRDNINDFEVWHYHSNWTPKNLQQERKFFEKHVCDDDSIVLMVCKDGESAGVIDMEIVDERGRIGDVGIWLARDFHGQGLGTASSELLIDYAFKQLNLHRIQAKVISLNEPSKNLWKKHGFTHEGTLREKVFVDGEHHDEDLFGILREDWLE